jgi:hypothetical protein
LRTKAGKVQSASFVVRKEAQQQRSTQKGQRPQSITLSSTDDSLKAMNGPQDLTAESPSSQTPNPKSSTTNLVISKPKSFAPFKGG